MDRLVINELVQGRLDKYNDLTGRKVMQRAIDTRGDRTSGRIKQKRNMLIKLLDKVRPEFNVFICWLLN